MQCECRLVSFVEKRIAILQRDYGMQKDLLYILLHTSQIVSDMAEYLYVA